MPAIDHLHQPVLVLNASYEPINVCAARRAVVLILKGLASAEEHVAAHIHSFNRAIPLPGLTIDNLRGYRQGRCVRCLKHEVSSRSYSQMLVNIRAIGNRHCPIAPRRYA